MKKDLTNLNNEELQKIREEQAKKEAEQIQKGEIHLDYSDEQKTILGLGNMHLEILRQALDNCVKAEKECFKQYMKNNPNEEFGNCLGRIQDALKPILEEINRCEPIDSGKAEKMPKYKPKPRSVIEKLEQTKELR